MGRQEENNEENDEPQPGSKAAREVRVYQRLAAAKRATRDKSCLRADQTSDRSPSFIPLLSADASNKIRFSKWFTEFSRHEN